MQKFDDLQTTRGGEKEEERLKEKDYLAVGLNNGT